MGTILIFLYIYSVASALACLFKKRFEMTLAPSIFLSILILYVSGLATGNLMFGVYLCVGIAAAGFLYSVVYGLKHKAIFKELCLTPGVLVYALLFIWIWFINHGRLFSIWDEFSHWGLVVKNMDFFNAFGNYEESTVYFRGYPPATALWQYFIGKLYGYFNEGHVYCAMGWFLTAMPVVMVKDLKWRNLGYAFFTVVVLVCIPLIFTARYITLLYVDAVLGVLTAYILIFSFYYERFDVFYHIILGATLCVLCLTKASGTFLAIIALLTVAVAYYISSDNSRKERVTILLRLLLCGGSGLLAGKYSWSIFLKLSNTREAWNTSTVTIDNLLDLVIGNGKTYQYETVSNFLHAIWNLDFMSSGVLHMTYFRWSIFFIVLSIGIYIILSAGIRSKLKTYLLGIWGGIAAYTLGLLILYIFTYSEYEATRLASFVRYLATYFTIIGLFLASVLLGRNATLSRRQKIIVMIFVIVIYVPFLDGKGIGVLTYGYQGRVNDTQKQRQEYMRILDYTANVNYLKDRIYIVSQNDTGADFWQLRYVITPIKTAAMPAWNAWSLGKPYYAGDIWTADISVEEWEKSLAKGRCKYVYLHEVDDRFTREYSSAFAEGEKIVSRAMYRLVPSGGVQKLVKVELEQ